jgi:hypothetical protein
MMSVHMPFSDSGVLLLPPPLLLLLLLLPAL